MLDAAAARPVASPLRAAVRFFALRRTLFAWVIASRVIVFVGAYILTFLRPIHHAFFKPHVYRTPFTVLGAWDGHWYRVVAAHGYLFVPGHRSDTAFFPLYPMILKSIRAVGLPVISTGIILSNLTFLVGIVAFYELTRMLFPDERQAYRACVYVAILPPSFVFSMEYPTSLVFTTLALCGLCALKRWWIPAAILVALATLARPEGLFFAAALLAIAVRQWPTLGPNERGGAVAAIAAAPAALVSFPLYLSYSLHDPHAWSESQHAWGRSFRPDGLFRTFWTLPSTLQHDAWLTRDAVAVAVYAALLVYAWRKGIGRGWIAASALIVILPLTTGSVESVARFGLVGFAFYWALARVSERRWIDRSLRVVFVGLLGAWMLVLPYANP